MSRKQKRAMKNAEPPAEKREYDNSVRQARNVAGPCNACQALLPLAKPPREQKTRVYAKKGAVRYCICDNCGNTWKRSL